MDKADSIYIPESRKGLEEIQETRTGVRPLLENGTAVWLPHISVLVESNVVAEVSSSERMTRMTRQYLLASMSLALPYLEIL